MVVEFEWNEKFYLFLFNSKVIVINKASSPILAYSISLLIMNLMKCRLGLGYWYPQAYFVNNAGK